MLKSAHQDTSKKKKKKSSPYKRHPGSIPDGFLSPKNHTSSSKPKESQTQCFPSQQTGHYYSTSKESPPKRKQKLQLSFDGAYQLYGGNKLQTTKKLHSSEKKGNHSPERVTKRVGIGKKKRKLEDDTLRKSVDNKNDKESSKKNHDDDPLHKDPKRNTMGEKQTENVELQANGTREEPEQKITEDGLKDDEKLEENKVVDSPIAEQNIEVDGMEKHDDDVEKDPNKDDGEKIQEVNGSAANIGSNAEVAEESNNDSQIENKQFPNTTGEKQTENVELQANGTREEPEQKITEDGLKDDEKLEENKVTDSPIAEQNIEVDGMEKHDDDIEDDPNKNDIEQIQEQESFIETEQI